MSDLENQEGKVKFVFTEVKVELEHLLYDLSRDQRLKVSSESRGRPKGIQFNTTNRPETDVIYYCGY